MSTKVQSRLCLISLKTMMNFQRYHPRSWSFSVTIARPRCLLKRSCDNGSQEARPLLQQLFRLHPTAKTERQRERMSATHHRLHKRTTTHRPWLANHLPPGTSDQVYTALGRLPMSILRLPNSLARAPQIRVRQIMVRQISPMAHILSHQQKAIERHRLTATATDLPPSKNNHKSALQARGNHPQVCFALHTHWSNTGV